MQDYGRNLVASQTRQHLLIVSGDAAALLRVLTTAAPGIEISCVSAASDARAEMAAKQFSTIVFDLRSAEAEIAFLSVAVIHENPDQHVLTIVPPQLAAQYRAFGGRVTVLTAPFTTDALAKAVALPDEPSVFRKQVSQPLAENATKGPVSVLLFPDAPETLPVSSQYRFVETGATRPDMIVLTEPGVGRRLAMSLPYAVAAITPIVDLSGGNEDISDLSATTGATALAMDAAIRDAAPMLERMRAMPAAVFLSEREDDVLLARLVVRNEGIQPRHRFDRKEVAAMPHAHVVGNIAAVANRLADAGALKKRFFDRLHCCASCESARLIIREECRSCRSPDIEEVSIIHHFPCGYQAPERDFVKGGELLCPKCTRSLEAFSVDYDRPGTMMVCNSCNNETGEAAVGYHCLDCSTNGDAAAMKTRTVHAYDLAEGAERQLANFAIAKAPVSPPRDHPISIMDDFIQRMEQAGKEFAAILVRIDRDGEIRREHGERTIRGSQHLIERALREALVKGVEVVPFNGSLAVLVPGAPAEQVRAELSQVLHFAKSAVALPIKVEGDVIAAERLTQIVRDPAARRGNSRA